MHSTLDSFKQDMNGSLPRQVGALVEQIEGQPQGKRLEESPNAGNPRGTSRHDNQGVLTNVVQSSLEAKPRRGPREAAGGISKCW
jgi:hypothetical protein